MVLVNDVRQVSRSFGLVGLVGDEGKLVDTLPDWKPVELPT